MAHGATFKEGHVTQPIISRDDETYTGSQQGYHWQAFTTSGLAIIFGQTPFDFCRINYLVLQKVLRILTQRLKAVTLNFAADFDARASRRLDLVL